MRERVKTLQNMIARAAVAAVPPSQLQLLAMVAEIGGILDALARTMDHYRLGELADVTDQAPAALDASLFDEGDVCL